MTRVARPGVRLYPHARAPQVECAAHLRSVVRAGGMAESGVQAASEAESAKLLLQAEEGASHCTWSCCVDETV